MSLETIVDFFVAYQRTAAIKAAVELDLFTAIGEGRDTIADLAERCQAAVRGVRILCDYLTVVGLLRKEDGRYALGSDAAAFLDRRSPAYAGSLVAAIASDTNLQAFGRLTASGPRPRHVRRPAREDPCGPGTRRARRRARLHAQRRSNLAAGARRLQPRHAGDHSRRRRLHGHRARPDVPQVRVRAYRAARAGADVRAGHDRVPDVVSALDRTRPDRYTAAP